MKMSKELVGSIVNAIRAQVEPEVVDAGGQSLTVYFLDDMHLAFTKTERQDFYGLTFEALGRDFSVINNLELLMAGKNDEGDDESFVVDDKFLLAWLEKYLALRIEVIEKLGA